MMIVPAGVRVHLALGYTDMRKGMDGHCHVSGTHSRQRPRDHAGHTVAVVAAFHSSIASARKRRRVGRLIMWRWTLKVL